MTVAAFCRSLAIPEGTGAVVDNDEDEDDDDELGREGGLVLMSLVSRYGFI